MTEVKTEVRDVKEKVKDVQSEVETFKVNVETAVKDVKTDVENMKAKVEALQRESLKGKWFQLLNIATCILIPLKYKGCCQEKMI